MIALKKFWILLKTHWYVPVIIVLAILFRNKTSNLEKMMSIQKDSYNKQIKEIEASYEKQRAKEKEINEKYKDTVKKIEDEYKKKNEALTMLSKKRVKSLVKKYYNEPDDLAKKLSERFGITYVPKNNSGSD